MPARLEIVDVTCAANVPATAPTEIPFRFNGGIVRRIHIVIPAGHAGKTGIALGYGHQQIIPFTSGAYFSGDDDVIHFDYIDATPGVAWSAFVCNTDLQLHAWQVRFELDEASAPATPPATTPIPAADIIAAGNTALSE